MRHQILKVSGWKSLRTGPLDYYVCPGCGELSEHDLVWITGDDFTCLHCDHTFPREAFKRTQKDVTFAVCAQCEHDLPLTLSSRGHVGYLCGCDNYVAVPFEGHLVQPDEIMTLEWNEGLRARGNPLTATCSASKCETDRDWQVMAVMQVSAKERNPEFKFADKDANKGLLLFDPVTSVYVGYLLWYEKKEFAILNQLFVVPGQRRKGHAEATVKYWLAEHARLLGEQFALESPNESAIALHMKLGHIRRERGYLVGVGGCVFVQAGF